MCALITPGSDGIVLSAAAWRYLQLACYSAFSMGRKLVPCDLDLWPLTLTFILVRASYQTRLPCEFGASTFSVSRDISYTNKQTNKKFQIALKQNLTQFTFTACGKHISSGNDKHHGTPLWRFCETVILSVPAYLSTILWPSWPCMLCWWWLSIGYNMVYSWLCECNEL